MYSSSGSNMKMTGPHRVIHLYEEHDLGSICRMTVELSGCTRFVCWLVVTAEVLVLWTTTKPTGSHPCPIHPTRVDSSEALYDSNRFARSRSALPEVNIREIMIQEPSSFLKRGNKIQSIRLRHVTIRLDSHAVDPQYRKLTSVK